MNYFLHLLTYFNIYLIVALSLNLVVGYCGLLTLAHAGLFAIGGYAYALLALNAGWGFLPAAFGGAVLASVVSLTISLPAWRLRGDFLVLTSLAVQALIFGTLNNWQGEGAPVGSWSNLTNGPLGIPGIPKPSIVFLTTKTTAEVALFSSAVSVAIALVVWRFSRSPWARALLAMREDEVAARGLGKETRILKIQAFAWSGAIAAIGGALYAAHVTYIDPAAASLDESILMLCMVLVGGLGNFWGPFVGASVLVLLPEALRFLSVQEAQAAGLRLLIYGVVLVAIMHLRPQGLAGAYRLDR